MRQHLERVVTALFAVGLIIGAIVAASATHHHAAPSAAAQVSTAPSARVSVPLPTTPGATALLDAGGADKPERHRARHDDHHGNSLRKMVARVRAVGTSLPFSARVATFNVLGSNHTGPGEDDARFAAGRVRAGWASSIIAGIDPDLVGLQEVQRDQLAVMHARLGGTYTFYPGTSWGSRAVPTNLMWRTDRFDLVTAQPVAIPFVGQTRVMALVELQDKATGRRFWIFNAHNAPQGRQVERNIAIAREAAAIRRVRATGDPLFFIGDFNEKASVYAAVARQTDLQSANAGIGADHSRLAPRGRLRVDWIFGSPDMTFTPPVQLRGGLVSRTTDHAVIWTDAKVD